MGHYKQRRGYLQISTRPGVLEIDAFKLMNRTAMNI